MSSAIPFYLLISLLMLTTTKTSISKANDIAIQKKYMPRLPESENLRIILHYVRKMENEKFYSSIFSLVSSDDESSIIFVDFLSKYVASEYIVSYKITTSDFSRMYTWQNHVGLTWIFIVGDTSTLNWFVHEQSHIWKATNQYIIIVTNPNMTWPREIFPTVWKMYGVYRIVIVSTKDDFRCLRRYLPFEKIRRNEYGAVHKICLTGREDNTELYVNIENLNGYPIRVVVFPSVTMEIAFYEDATRPKFNGVDANAMLLLERAMGARFHINVFRMINSINGDYEDPFHRTLQYIENGEAELIVNSFFVHQYKEYEKYEFTATIYEDKLCLIAPTAGFVPKSYMPIMSFAPDLWVALAMYNILVSIVWFLIKYYSVSFRQRKAVVIPLERITESSFATSHRRRFANLFPGIHPYVLSCFDLVETWCYPLKENSGSASTTTTTAQRAFLIGTLFFGLIVTGLYQSCLMSSLSDPFHYPELKTLEDVASSNLTLITKYYNVKESTFTGNTTLDNKLHSKTQLFVAKERTYDAVAFDRKTIAISRYASVKLTDMSKYYDIDGNELLHIVEEYPTTYLLSYVMRIYSPYRERINGLLLRMQEAGLVRLWYERMAHPFYVAEQKRRADKRERKIRLTMEHYSFTFIGLAFGLFSCVVVFLAELYLAKISSRLVFSPSFNQ